MTMLTVSGGWRRGGYISRRNPCAPAARLRRADTLSILHVVPLRAPASPVAVLGTATTVTPARPA